MAPPSIASATQITPIPFPYRIFFLYLDPLLNVSGIYIFFFDQAMFIQNGIPSALKPTSNLPEGAAPVLDPIAKHFVRSLGSYSVGILVLQILLLHGFKNAKGGLNVKIWRMLQFAILTIDVSLLYGIFLAGPAAFFNLSSWDSTDWTTNGSLGFVALVRAAFLLGLGM